MFVNHRILEHYPRYMHLRLYVDQSANPDLYQKYYEAMYAHNTKVNDSAVHIDAGFDLYAPNSQNFSNSSVNRLDFQVKCSAQIVEGNERTFRTYNTGYYMHPRSSISKTQLRLANSTGIVDSGYRGNLIGMFDCLIPSYSIEQNDRLIQICAPGLMPIFVELTDKIEHLGAKTLRGEGGIGSSGR